MGQATVYCEICGDMIPEQEFDKGKALRHEGKNYCNNHRSEVPGADTPGSGVAKPGSGVFRSTGTPIPAVRRQSGGFQPAAVGKTAASGTAKRSSSGIRKAISAQVLKPVTPSEGQRAVNHEANRGGHETGHTKRKAKGPNMTVIITAVAIAIVVVVGGFMVWQSMAAKKRADDDEARRKRAETAVNDVKKLLSGPTIDYDAVLREVADVRDKVKGISPFEDDLQRIAKDAETRQQIARVKKELEDKVRTIIEEADKDRPNFAEYVKKLAALYKEVADPSEALTAKVKEESRNIRRKGIQALIEETRRQVYTPNPAYKKPLEELGKLEDECEDMPELVKEVQDEIGRVQKVRDDAAQAAYRKLASETDQLCTDGNFTEALKRLDQFPAELEESSFYSDVLKLRSYIIQRQRTGKKPKPGGDEDKLGAADEVQLFNGEDMRGWQLAQGSNGSWDVDRGDRCIKGVNSQSGPDTPDKGLFTFRGERDWADLDFVFEARVRKGSGFMVISHVGSSGSSAINFDVKSKGVWNRWTVQYRGNEATVLTPEGTTNKVRLAGNSTAGLIGFGLKAGDEADFRNITVKPMK